MKKSISISLGAIVLFAWSSLAYGPTGHEIVGGIADNCLANTPTGAKVKTLIDGITLEKACVIPDEIKSWDKNGADDLNQFPHYSDHPKIDNQLRDFWRANQPTHDPNLSMPSHHWFHYTDVPVLNAHKYSDGKTGRSQWDVVHMINYCVSVLEDQTSENNPRKITKPVAIILLAHYVGDIHQPLHVGAEYFDEAGRAVDPDRGKPGIADEGGNTIILRLRSGTPEELAHRSLKLHGFWDNDAVIANLVSLPLTVSKEERQNKTEQAKRQLIERLSREQPTNWRLPREIALENYAEAWADEILPIARQAHERLEFSKIHPQLDQDRYVSVGIAQEKIVPGRILYADWAANVVRDELHKAGWRLADLLEKVVTSTTTIAAPPTTPPAPPPAEPRANASTSSQTSPGPTSIFGTYPVDYREIVSSWMKANGFDVSKIDWQSDPKPADVPALNGRHLYGYLVIFNMPGASGTKTRSLLIRDQAVINVSGFDQ